VVATCAIATSLSAATIDDAEVELAIEFDSGFEDADEVEQEYEIDSLMASQPITFSATQSSGGATSQAGFSGAISFDGDVVSLTLDPTLLLSQTVPTGDEFAVMQLEFDGIELEAEEDDPFGGFVLTPFTLSGNIDEDGFARLRADLELSVEGPETEIDEQEISFDRTFDADFEFTTAELFGAGGLLGVDLSTTDFSELELSGTIWFEALGGTTATELRVVTGTSNGTGSTSDPLEQGEGIPEPNTILLILSAAVGLACYPRFLGSARTRS
jgi:hypothetical protein